MKANKQVRVDSLGAQAMATSNGTFDAISSYNKLTLLLVRNYARRTRNKRKRELDTAKQDAAQCKLARVAGKHDADLCKKQMKFMLSLIHYGVVPDTLKEFDAIMADTTRGCKGKQARGMLEIELPLHHHRLGLCGGRDNSGQQIEEVWAVRVPVHRRLEA